MPKEGEPTPDQRPGTWGTTVSGKSVFVPEGYMLPTRTDLACIVNWPEDKLLPTKERVREAVEEGQRTLDRLLEDSRKKLPRYGPRRQFTI